MWKMRYFRSCTTAEPPEEGACESHLEKTKLFISTIMPVFDVTRKYSDELVSLVSNS